MWSWRTIALRLGKGGDTPKSTPTKTYSPRRQVSRLQSKLIHEWPASPRTVVAIILSHVPVRKKSQALEPNGDTVSPTGTQHWSPTGTPHSHSQVLTSPTLEAIHQVDQDLPVSSVRDGPCRSATCEDASAPKIQRGYGPVKDVLTLLSTSAQPHLGP